MSKKRSINIDLDLLDGDPNGIWIAHIKGTRIRAIAFPRDELRRVRKDFPDMDEEAGVYILIGGHEHERRIAYIGESEEVGRRLSNHKKDFWDDTVVLVSTNKDGGLTKSEAMYLESRLIPSVSTNPRWDTPDNKNTPRDDAGKLPQRERDNMDEYVEQAKMLVRAFGWDMFHGVREHTPGGSPTKPKDELPRVAGRPMFSMKGEGYAADMIVNAPKEFVVQAGSRARVRTIPSFTLSSTALRNELLEEKVLRQDGNYLLFASDYTFLSVTAAAQVVCGGKVSGKAAWKLPDGSTYADWKTRSEEDPVKPDVGLSEITGSPMFSMSGRGYKADMTVSTSGEFVVHAGSKAKVKAAPTLPLGSSSLRNVLLEKGVLYHDGSHLLFTSDYRFSSASTAAETICGTSTNGRLRWKLTDGSTYAEWEAGLEKE